MDTNQLKPSLWAVLERPNDVKFIKLPISSDPEALVSVVGGADIVAYFQNLPAENSFSNHDKVDSLLWDCWKAFMELRFPRLIKLCCTADALEALVAAHVDDDLSLHVLCYRRSWNKVLAGMKQLPTQAVVDELLSQDERGCTALALASVNKAPVEVLESMIHLAELDAEKRNILDIATFNLCLPLHHTAQDHPDPAATKLLVRHYHPTLLANDHELDTPLDCAIQLNESPAVADLLSKLVTAYKHDHFSALIRLCGTSELGKQDTKERRIVTVATSMTTVLWSSPL